MINALGRILLQDPDQGALSTLFAATEDIPGGSFVVPVEQPATFNRVVRSFITETQANLLSPR